MKNIIDLQKIQTEPKRDLPPGKGNAHCGSLCSSAPKYYQIPNRIQKPTFSKWQVQTRQIWILSLIGLWTAGMFVNADEVSIQNHGTHSPKANRSGNPSFQEAPMDDFWTDPFLEMEQIHRNMMRLFRQSHLSPQWGQHRSGGFFSPRTDVQEFPDRYLIQLDLPGMDKEKLEISITDDAITVTGERSFERQENSDEGMYLMERSFGKFQRALPMPHNVKQESISAIYEKGVLTITLPKLSPTPEHKELRKIQIT